MSRRHWFLFITVGLLWGMPYLLLKVSVRELSVPVIVCSRTLIGALILVPIALHQKTLLPALKKYHYVLLYAVLELFIPWLLITAAEQKITSGLAGLLVATVPIWTTVIASVKGDKTVWHKKRLGGLLIGFIGVLLVVGIESLRSDQNPLAIIMILIALPDHMPTAHVIASQITLGLLPTAMAFILFFELMRDVGPARASLVTYLNTAFAVVLGVVILHEPLTLGILVGLPLVLIGSYFAGRKSVTQ